MPETCGVLWQNKFWIFDAFSWLFYANTGNFDVLLTVHLSIILVINQLNAQILVL